MNGWRCIVRTSVWASSSLVACAGGTETDNPRKPGDLVSFEASACKKEAPEESGRSSEALVASSEYDGLTCVEWETEGSGVLTLRILNLNGGCSVPWNGNAEVQEDGSLDLTLENPKCAIAACGWCLYDFRFTVRGAPPPGGLPLRIGTIACPGEAPSWDHALSLPEDAGDSGIVCRYAHPVAYDEQLEREDRCGAKFGTCGGQGGFCTISGTEPCREGLVCSAADATDRCLEPCDTDEDCSPRAVSACVDGICRLAASY
jgi:hypothetical protein